MEWSLHDTFLSEKSLDSFVDKEPVLSFPLSTINSEGFSNYKFKRSHHLRKVHFRTVV